MTAAATIAPTHRPIEPNIAENSIPRHLSFKRDFQDSTSITATTAPSRSPPFGLTEDAAGKNQLVKRFSKHNAAGTLPAVIT